MVEEDHHHLIDLWHRVDLEEWPVGVFILDERARFVAANKAARQILGLPQADALQHLPFAERCKDKAECKKLWDKVRRCAREKQEASGCEKDQPPCDPHKGTEIRYRLIDEQGRETTRWIRLFCQPLTEGEVIRGYYAVVANTEDAHVLQERLESLTLDIGRVLHAVSTALVMVSSALRPTLEFMGRQTNFAAEVLLSTPEESFFEALSQRARILADKLEALLQNAQGDPRKHEALLRPQWEFLEQQIPRLRAPYAFTGESFSRTAQPAFLREVAMQIRDTLRRARPHTLPRSQVREVHQAAESLEILSLLAPLVTSYLAIAQLARPLDALRDFITTNVREEEPFEEMGLRGLLREASEELKEFANARGIEIRLEESCVHALCKCQKRDIQRALMNLIHNAIKYTWPRQRGSRPWVLVRLSCPSPGKCQHVHGPCAQIMIENWGTPIPPDEIEDETIFQIGYRGRLAKDRLESLGTGIGLADARHVIRKHKGEITITSRPANPARHHERDPEYYNQPFLTRVTVELPLIS